jgi:hypothetical protein
MYGHEEVVRILAALLPLNDIDRVGNTAVHYAARYGVVGVLKLLVSSGADYMVQNKFGETAEDLAREAGFNACVNTLRVRRRQTMVHYHISIHYGGVSEAPVDPAPCLTIGQRRYAQVLFFIVYHW